MRRGSKGLLALLGAITLSAMPALADQQQCEANQLKEISRYSKKYYECLSKSVKKNSGAGECLAAASNQLTDKLEKISEKDGCEVETDFDALNEGLQAALDRDANAIFQSLNRSYASIEPCELDYADVWHVTLLKAAIVEFRVDTVDNRYYFDPGLTITGVTNSVCVTEDRPAAQIMPFEFECTFDPQMLDERVCAAGPNAGVDCTTQLIPAQFCQTSPGAFDGMCVELNPDGICPGATMVSGPTEQICALTVFVEGQCEDLPENVNDVTRADYTLEVTINGRTAVAERVQSNVAP